jgi:hypothetical protein
MRTAQADYELAIRIASKQAVLRWPSRMVIRASGVSHRRSLCAPLCAYQSSDV